MSRGWIGLACVLALGAGSASAQPAAPPARLFDQGPVVVIEEIRVLPGKRRAYNETVAGHFRHQLEAAKRRGEVLDYKMLNNVHPREGEGDVFFIVTYRDAAVMDATEAKRRQAEADAASAPAPAAPVETLREILNVTMLREMVFRAPPPGPPPAR
jgi:hypothetical protein